LANNSLSLIFPDGLSFSSEEKQAICFSTYLIMNEENIDKYMLTFYKFSEKLNPEFTQIVSFRKSLSNQRLDEQKKLQEQQASVHGQGHCYYIAQP
jgi:hypothetical protein